MSVLTTEQLQDHNDLLEKLRTLRRQVDCAISCVESGMSTIVGRDRKTPDRIEVGDFIITNRFTEPQA